MHFAFEDHIEYMKAGDSVYYNSSKPHGMIAVGGQDCVFLAVVMKGAGGMKAELSLRLGDLKI
jgi:quercetin dioxygenase-like cupin family protein